MVTDMAITQMETILMHSLTTGEWKDTDGDGVGDNGDDFPTDGTQWVDADEVVWR